MTSPLLPSSLWSDAELSLLGLKRIVSEPTNVEEARAHALAKLAEVRYQHETGGAVVGQNFIPSDRETQMKLAGAALMANLNENFVVNWKLADGVFISLNAEEIIQTAQGLAVHVQACFANEAALTAAIMEAADMQSISAVDLGAGWP